MSVVWRITFLFCVLFIINSISTTPVPEKENEKAEDESTDSDKEESNSKEKGTVSPEVFKKLEEEILETEVENAEKFGVPVTIKPEDVETYLKKEEKVYGTDLPEVVEKELAETKTNDENKNLVNFIGLFNKVEIAVSKKEEVTVKKTPEEMRKLKEETYRLMNELDQRTGLPEVSPEKLDEIWNEKKKEHGEQFPVFAEKTVATLKKTLDQWDTKTAVTTPEVSETETVTSTQSADILKEESPQGTFALRNGKGNICILAKFHSSIMITYPGKTSELKRHQNNLLSRFSDKSNKKVAHEKTPIS